MLHLSCLICQPHLVDSVSELGLAMKSSSERPEVPCREEIRDEMLDVGFKVIGVVQTFDIVFFEGSRRAP